MLGEGVEPMVLRRIPGEVGEPMVLRTHGTEENTWRRKVSIVLSRIHGEERFP